MCKLVSLIIIYLAIEIFANLAFFYPLKRVYGSKQQEHEKTLPWIKGALERICLITGLLMGYPQILIAFGALKIGTKINNETINSEYYLLGNLASILTCFIFSYFVKSGIIVSFAIMVLGCY